MEEAWSNRSGKPYHKQGNVITIYGLKFGPLNENTLKKDIFVNFFLKIIICMN